MTGFPDLTALLLELQSPKVFSAFFYALFRVSAFVLSAPFFSASMVSKNIKGVYALVLSVLLAPTLEVPEHLLLNDLTVGVITAILQQVMIGLIVGFVFMAMFDVLRMTGQNISYATQLGFAQMVEPGTGVQSSVIGNALYTIGRLYFLATFGLSFIVATLIDSFATLPISDQFLAQASLLEVTLWFSRIWTFAMILSVPSLGLSLLMNAAMAVVTRTAPSLNIFSIGFPLVIVIGIMALSKIVPYLLHTFGLMVEPYMVILDNIG